MTTSPLKSAVAKLEAANLTNAEIDSLAEALALTIANANANAGAGDEVQGFLDASSPKQDQGVSMNYEEIKWVLRDQMRTPRNVFVVMEANYTDAGRVT